MGKRELLLIVGFLAAGGIIYHATAPPSTPGQDGFSLSQLWKEIRADITDNQLAGDFTVSATAGAGPAIRQFQVRELRGAVTIAGEARQDVTAELKVTVTGADQKAAEAMAKQFTITLRPTADTLDLLIGVPEGARRYRTHLSVKLPKRLAVQLEATTGPVNVHDVAELRMNVLRSETTIARIKGEVRGEQRDGSLAIQDAGSVRLVTRRADLVFERISGESSLDISDAGLELRTATGPFRIDGRRADLEIADVGALHIVETDGEIHIERPREPLKIESLRADVAIRLSTPIAVDVNCTDAPIELTMPGSGGVSLDALATDGEIRLEDGDVRVIGEESEKRAQGPIAGGGPTLRLRTTRSDITVRKK